MTPKAFRSIALGFPGVVESDHMRHPDFRCRGRIFATLGYPDVGWGMVKLSPDQQKCCIEKAPDTFSMASGAWGRSGSTLVRLAAAKTAVVRETMLAAFNNVAALKGTPVRPAVPKPAPGRPSAMRRRRLRLHGSSGP
jgi:hypothetical protein